MELRQLGKSNLMVPPVSLGAWAIGGWMWGGTDIRQSVEAIRASLDHGINVIDTAAVYGFGLSEEIISRAIEGQRENVLLFTKCGLRWDLQKGSFYFETQDEHGKILRLYKYAGKESVIEECERSLKRLNTDVIDLYQVHWPDPTTPVEETMEALLILKQQGKIRAAGVSNFSVPLMMQCRSVIDLASNQLPYSMVRREIEQDLVPACIRQSVGIIAYSPLQRGLLAQKFSPAHSFSAGDSRPQTIYYTPGNIARVNDFLEKIKPLAIERRITLAQLVLAWTFHQPGITTVLAGARNARQAIENAGAARLILSPDELNQINNALNTFKLEQ